VIDAGAIHAARPEGHPTPPPGQISKAVRHRVRAQDPEGSGHRLVLSGSERELRTGKYSAQNPAAADQPGSSVPSPENGREGVPRSGPTSTLEGL
jgi:hypothetical protein